MGATARLTGLALVSVMLAGCSETGFQDWFGAGKYIPDENQVSQGRVLSAPPDLQLHPPGTTQQPAQPVQQVAQAPTSPTPPSSYQQSVDGKAPIYEPKKTYQQAPQQQQAYQPQQPPAYQAPQPQPQQVSQAPQQLQPQASNDPYARWGVSRYNADGTKKTQVQLDQEMRKKKLEIERQKNPNYGTIWNLGSIWSNG